MKRRHSPDRRALKLCDARHVSSYGDNWQNLLPYGYLSTVDGVSDDKYAAKVERARLERPAHGIKSLTDLAIDRLTKHLDVVSYENLLELKGTGLLPRIWQRIASQ